ncbi:MAG: nucleoside deaminase [Clostridia bacterium]|nr:nucleoside deaminase [Clostridia bacterium]
MFTETDEKMMRFALEEARIALHEGEIPVGAVIANGDILLARAHNTRERDKDPIGHAEINVIREAAKKMGRWRLNNLTMYVTLEPCPMCAGAIQMSGMKRLVYGARDERYGCAGSVYRITEDPAFQNYCPADGGLYEDEAAQLLSEFFKSLRLRGE